MFAPTCQRSPPTPKRGDDFTDWHTDVWDCATADVARARSAGFDLRAADFLTMPGIIGERSDRQVLRETFGAAVVDMETAALARVASSRGVPLAAVRSVSDCADSDLLAPFGYDPAASPLRRAGRMLFAGRWLGRYREWRVGSRAARASLGAFLEWYLDNS